MKGNGKFNAEQALLSVTALNGAPFDVEEVTRTVDGSYLARERGDIGFNRFLGRPKPSSWSKQQWEGLTNREQLAVLAVAVRWGVALGDFGIGV